jgi:hypothetical protein
VEVYVEPVLPAARDRDRTSPVVDALAKMAVALGWRARSSTTVVGPPSIRAWPP